MTKGIFWIGYSHEERHEAINRIKQTIAVYGDIIDFHPFSDISLSMTIEIMESKIDVLRQALSAIIDIQAEDSFHSNSDKERLVYLNITFSKSTGNLIIEVPSVPG